MSLSPLKSQTHKCYTSRPDKIRLLSWSISNAQGRLLLVQHKLDHIKWFKKDMACSLCSASWEF